MHINEIISEGPISAIKGAVNKFKQDVQFGQDYVDTMAQQKVDRETTPAAPRGADSGVGAVTVSSDKKKTAFTNRLSGKMTNADIAVFKQLTVSDEPQLAAAAKNASRSLPLSSADERVLRQELKYL